MALITLTRTLMSLAVLTILFSSSTLSHGYRSKYIITSKETSSSILSSSSSSGGGSSSSGGGGGSSSKSSSSRGSSDGSKDSLNSVMERSLIGPLEICQWQSLNATCEIGSVIMIHSARYGRMRNSKCIDQLFGSVGCSLNVQDYLEHRCAGRGQCHVRMPDEHLEKQLKVCPTDLKAYLEVTYFCMKVTYIPNYDCKGKEIIITSSSSSSSSSSPTTSSSSSSSSSLSSSTSGYLSNYITGETQQGSDSCPWVIRGQPGSKFKFTLMDYAVIDGGPVKSGVCSIYGKINETLICGGEHRSHVIFTSIDDVVRVEISNPRPVKESPYFLFKYELFHCPDLLAPSGSVFLEKQPDKLVLFCRHDSNNDNNHHNNYHNNKNNYDVNNYNNDFIINRGSAGRKLLNGSLKIVSNNNDDDVIGEYKNKNKNNNLWTLTCVGNKWIGKVPNCTHQDDVGGMGGSWGLTGQIFGSSGQVSRNIIAFFIAVIALLVAVSIVVVGVFSIARSRKKSREERRRRDVREKVLGVTSSSSSAILDSLVVQGQLNSSSSMANSSIQHLQQLPPPPYHERSTMTNAQREKDYRYHALSKLVSEADFDSAKVSNLMPPKKSHIAMKVAGSYVMPPPPSSSSSSHVSCSSHPLPPASAIQKNILNNINNNNININNSNINNSNINNSSNNNSNLADELSNVDTSGGDGSLLVLNFNRPLQQLFPQQQQQLFQQQQFQQQYPTKQLYQHSQFSPLTQQQQPQEQQQQLLQQQYDEHIYESPKFLHKSYMDVHSASNE